MGEVYRARDTNLGRDVALKILPDNVASDGDRVVRFRREAQILASLNHPLIAAIYGVEDSGATPVLVLELVEGVTLAERIGAGPLPLDEALPIAQQIAQALEAAHERGIIHRDLKPANIKLRPDGTVKVLDFGLARALEPPSGDLASGALATVTSPAVTAFGVILGTAAYMSPEQACGQSVDRGTDIWAFGAVLFEMLTGSRAFEGSDPTQTVASVLRSEPDWSRLRSDTPESIRRLLRRCLEKDRRRRLADIRDANLEIEDAQREPLTPLPAIHDGLGSRERWLWIGGFGVVAAAAAGMLLSSNTVPPVRTEQRVEIVTPPTPDPVSFAISPDGRHLAFVAVTEGRTQLWVRNLETGIAQPLRGTDGVSFPFWSPDSQSIGFFASERLFRVRLDGSAPRSLGSIVIGTGGTWNESGTILTPMVPDSQLYRLPAEGGQPETQTLPPPPGGHRFPCFLPDGQHFLFFVAESRTVFLGSLDGSAPRHLLDADGSAVFAPPSDVLFVRDGVLYAQRLDMARLVVDGSPVSLAKGVAISDGIGAAAISASREGTIAYRTGSGAQHKQFVWFDRSGKRLREVGTPGSQLNPTLSPDGRQIVFTRTVGGNNDVWISDAERGIPTPLTRQPLPDVGPIWAIDGRSIAYSAANTSRRAFEIRTRPIRTEAESTPILEQPLAGFPMHYSHDGRYLLYRTRTAAGRWDIWALSLFENRDPIPVATSPDYDQRVAQFSPDSRFIAYESNETGQFQIYVRPFKPGAASKPVSAGGGSQPRWRRYGKEDMELFYVAPDSSLMSVAIRGLPGDELSIGQPVPLFSAPIMSSVQGGLSFEYDVSADGKEFLVNTFVEHPPVPISLILNRRPLR
jgi:eukaryotic-like serine/threonine-protein kinase